VSRDAEELPAEIRESVPEFDDEYLDRVAGRLLYNYDLQKDHRTDGQQWELYGEMRVKSQKQFFHPALSYGDHESEEYLLAQRIDRPTVEDLRRLVDRGHELADGWITADEEHYGTDITFVLIAEEIPDALLRRAFIAVPRRDIEHMIEHMKTLTELGMRRGTVEATLEVLRAIRDLIASEKEAAALHYAVEVMEQLQALVQDRSRETLKRFVRIAEYTEHHYIAELEQSA